MSNAKSGTREPELFSYVDAAPPATAGALAGKSVVIQPNMSVRGWPTEAGSAALEKFVALEDATVAERLRAAGATIVGSTRMAELGFGLVGDTTPRVLAEGHCDVALVTDTMGEARHVAAMAGAVGFKPSYGIVSRFGLIGLVPSMECYGVVASSAADAAAVMAALAGFDERDPSMRDAELPAFAGASVEQDEAIVAGVVRECTDALDSVEADAFRSVLPRLAQAGLKIQEVSLPGFDLFAAVHNVVGSTEASSSAGKYDSVRYGHRAAGAENWNEMYLESRAECFGGLVKRYLFQGAYFQFENYAAFENACKVRRRLVEETHAAFEKVDVLLCPTRRPGRDAGAANTIEATYDAFALTLPANVVGNPSLSVPNFVAGAGLDLGLQIVAPPLADARLLALGARLANSGS